MQLSSDRLAQSLEGELGAGAVTGEPLYLQTITSMEESRRCYVFQ
jgi:hypothetical protein